MSHEIGILHIVQNIQDQLKVGEGGIVLYKCLYTTAYGSGKASEAQESYHSVAMAYLISLYFMAIRSI